MTAKSSDILKELESDDEFPDLYNDVSILPAYLNDNRFDEIKFPWINNMNQNYKDTPFKNHIYEYRYGMLRYKGILRRQDLYCLKSVESCTCSSTLIWFVNFLLYKDLQSDYNFLKSCLVNDINSIIPFNKKKYAETKETVLENRFEIVIKSN